MYLNYITKVTFYLGCLCLFDSVKVNAQKNTAQKNDPVQFITTADKKQLFEKKLIQPDHQNNASTNGTIIQVNPLQTFQKMEGFGYAITGGSATLIHGLEPLQQNKFLQEIFGSNNNDLGVSYIRISMGASDLDASVFSYCDLPTGEVDSALQHFSLSEDTIHLIPILKKVIALNPKIKIMATPWSPPIWMKTNRASIGGHLEKKYYASYANYFVKYIQAMHAMGITISAITIQNEPEHGGNNPSMLMDAKEQAEFIRTYLGPAFKQANLSTEIVIWDHNADHPNYPITILNDAQAKSFVAASAFHLYLGEASALSKVHEQHPDKKIYFTEQWTGAKGDFGGDFMWHLEHIVIGTIQNWSSLVLEWNLASDANYNPHTPGGCTECKGAFTIQDQHIDRNVSYYIIGQISKFVPAGSQRIASLVNDPAIKSVAFLLPNGNKVLIALNTAPNEKEVRLLSGENSFTVHLPIRSASTIIW